MVATEYPVSLTIAQIVDSYTNARDPNAHKSSHAAGGSDALKLDELAAATTTTRNATTGAAGLVGPLPGSGSVFLNGNGGFTVPSGSGSSFKPAIYVGSVDGCDYTSISAAVAAAQSGSEIIILPGTYSVTSQINCNKSLTIRGIGEVIVNINLSSGDYGFYFYGSVVTNQALSTNALKNADRVTLSTGSSVQAGDLVGLTISDIWSSSDYAELQTGEIYYCASKPSDNVVELNEPVKRDYTTAKSARAYVYRPITVELENIRFINIGTVTNSTPFKFSYCKGLRLTDCEFANGGYWLIDIDTSFDTVVSKCHIHGCQQAGYGYGIAVNNACANTKISECTIERCRHCVSATWDNDYIYGEVRDMYVINNHLTGSTTTEGQVIDTHANALNITIEGNTIHAIGGTAGYVNGAENWIFKNNHVYGNAVSSRSRFPRGKGIIEGNIVEGGYLYQYNYAKNTDSLEIINNRVTGGSHGVDISANEFVGKLTIANNIIDSCSANGIDIAVPSGAAATSSINISGNTLTVCGVEGIKVRRNNTSQKVNCVINGNVVSGFGASGAALYLVNLVYASVVGNTVHNGGYGMYEEGSCNYNAFVGNVTGGVTTPATIVGANTVDANNIKA